MNNFNNILEEIRKNSGIKRIKYPLNDRENAVKYFISIADAMLAWKNVKYNAEPVMGAIKAIVDWTYLLDNENISSTKGIMLKGSTGRGKTFLFRVWKEFLKIDNIHFFCNGEKVPLFPKEVNARTLAFNYERDGYEALIEYAKCPSLIINDIGAESVESVNFGNKLNVVDRLLDLREERNLLTFATSNLEKFSTNYDARTISRMNSLFNVITISHDIDFRKI